MTTNTPRLDEIELHLTEADTRSHEAIHDLEGTNRLLSRAEHDRQRLVRDAYSMVITLRGLQARHAPDGNTCRDCAQVWPCTTAQTIQTMGGLS